MKLWTPLLLIFATGCAIHGIVQTRTITEKFNDAGEVVERSDKSTKTILPKQLENNSKIEASGGDVSAEISGQQKPPVHDIVTEKTAASGMILAGGFAAAAVALIALRFTFFPIIPLVAPIACGGASALFFMLPTVVDRHSGKITLGLAAALAWSAYEGWHQDKLHKKDPPSRGGTPNADNDPV